MAITIRELLVRLGVKADQQKVERFDAALDAAKGTMLLGAAAAGALTTALTGLVLSTARQGDQAAKMAQRLGLGVEEMQELTVIAGVAGAKLEDLQSALGRQAEVVTQARDDNEGMIQTLRAVGIEVDQLADNVGQLDILQMAADGLRDVGTEAERIALVRRIFGEGGAKLLPLLNQGSEGIARMRMEIRELGVIIDEEGARQAEEFTDRLGDLRRIAQGLRNTIGLALLPRINDMLEGFRDWFVLNRAIIQQRLGSLAEGIADGFDFMRNRLADVDRFVRDRLGGWGRLFSVVAAAFGTVGIVRGLVLLRTIIAGVTAALPFLGTAAGVVFSPMILVIGAVALAVGALFLAVEDLITGLRGGESVIIGFIDRWRDSEGLLGDIARLLIEIGDLGVSVGEAVSELAAVLAVEFGPALQLVGALLQGVLVGGLRLAVESLRSFVEFLTAAVRLTRQLVDAITDLARTTPEALRSPLALAESFGAPDVNVLANAPIPRAIRAGIDAAGGTGTTNQINQGPVSFVLSGLGLTQEEVQRAISNALQENQRRAAAAIVGNGNL